MFSETHIHTFSTSHSDYETNLSKRNGTDLSPLYFDGEGLRKYIYFYRDIFNNEKREDMLTTNDVAKVYDTILSIPGMNETVKIDMRISRRNVLLLNSVIRRGLTGQNNKTHSLLDNIPKEALQELTVFADSCLQKAGLTELSEKLNFLNEAKS